MKKNLASFLRWFSLLSILIAVTAISYLHSIGNKTFASIHAICPLGAMESIYTLASNGEFIRRISIGTFMLFALVLLISILFKRAFCGILCPLGALQELFGKLNKRKFVIPQKFDKYLRWIKYLVLIVTLYMAFKTATLWISPYDPWAAYAHLLGGFDSVMSEIFIGFIILIVSIIGSILFERFFCKYICPYGAFVAIIGKLSPFKVERNKEKCIDCGLCSKVCPVNIDVQNKEKVKDLECIDCGICVNKCPKEGALSFKWAKYNIKPAIYVIMVIVIFIGGVLTMRLTGILNPENKKVEYNEKTVINQEKDAEKKESITPNAEKIESIKGFMTIKDASATLNISTAEFKKMFKIPENTNDTTALNKIPNYNFSETKHKILGE